MARAWQEHGKKHGGKNMGKGRARARQQKHGTSMEFAMFLLAMFLPCSGHALAVLLPCYCHLLHCYCRVIIAMLLP
jgi:hypothetical protein